VKKTESTPFLLIEDGKIEAYGQLVGRPVSEGFFLVQFEGPGARHGRIVAAPELTRFTLFASNADREAFVNPPKSVDTATPTPPELPQVPGGNSQGDNAE